MQMSRKIYLIKAICLGLIGFLVLLLSGCWDHIPIENRASVLALSFDTVSQDEVDSQQDVVRPDKEAPIPQGDGVRMTAQIAVPSRLPLGPGGGGQGGGGSEKPPVWLVSVVAPTVDAAMVDLQQKIAGRLFLGHLRVVVVSEPFAKRGIAPMTDYFRRNPEVRRTTWLTVTKAPAEQLLRVAPPLERVPALYLTDMLDRSVRLGKLPRNLMGRYWTESSAIGEDPVLAYIVGKGQNNIQVAGLAYFLEDKMVDVLEPIHIGHYLEVKRMNQGGYSVILPIPGKQGYYIFKATRRYGKITVDVQKGKPHFTVKVRLDGRIEEMIRADPATGISDDLIHKMEAQIEQETIQGQKEMFQKLQKKGSDIFGLGEYVRAKLPGYWNEHVPTSETWHEIYKSVPVDFKVEVKLRRFGSKAT